MLRILYKLNFATSLRMDTNDDLSWHIRINPQPWLQNSHFQIR